MTRRTARYVRFRACIGKRRYYGRREAFKAANSASERTGQPHRIYQCDYCGKFHITHLSKALFDYYNEGARQ